MLIQGQVQQSVPSARSAGQPNINLDQLGNLSVTEVLPRYAAATWSGQVFCASNTAAQALSVASATFTGLAVGNPTGSGKNLVIIDATAAIDAAAAAVGDVVIGYAAYVALTAGASAGPFNNLVGAGASSVAKVGASATLGAAPTVIKPLLGIQWVTGGTSAANIVAKDEIAGSIIVPPGYLICLEALTAAQSVVGGFTWMEVPI